MNVPATPTPMPSPVPRALANVPGLEDLVGVIEKLHAEHTSLLNKITTAEDEYIRAIAAAHGAGQVD